MKITGHRGAKDELPENTILGISKAIELGVKAIEIDIHKSNDGKLFVIHDHTLDRTTNGSGPILSKSSAELRELDAGQGEKIPFLEEVLELCMKNAVHLFIECKAKNLSEEVVKVIEQYEAYDSCHVICFYHPLVKQVKEMNSRINVGCITVANPIDPVTMVKNAKASWLGINISTVDKTLVDACHKGGIEVAVWNANTKEEFEAVNSLGVDYIMTDRPSDIVPLA